MATARLDMRLDKNVKEKAEKASALLGMKSLTEYLVKLMDEDASRVIEEHESFIVENSMFDRFMTACENAQQPNQTLRDAAAFTRDRGIK